MFDRRVKEIVHPDAATSDQEGLVIDQFVGFLSAPRGLQISISAAASALSKNLGRTAGMEGRRRNET